MSDRIDVIRKLINECDVTKYSLISLLELCKESYQIYNNYLYTSLWLTRRVYYENYNILKNEIYKRLNEDSSILIEMIRICNNNIYYINNGGLKLWQTEKHKK